VIRNLYAALNETAAPLAPAGFDEIPNGKIFTLLRPTELLALVVPERTLTLDQVRAAAPAATRSGTAKVVDLATGFVSRRRWERRGESLAIDGGVACAVPTLICFANPRSAGPDSGT
jgi:hypothetical protein